MFWDPNGLAVEYLNNRTWGISYYVGDELRWIVVDADLWGDLLDGFRIDGFSVGSLPKGIFGSRLASEVYRRGDILSQKLIEKYDPGADYRLASNPMRGAAVAGKATMVSAAVLMTVAAAAPVLLTGKEIVYLHPGSVTVGEEILRSTIELVTNTELGPSANDFVGPAAKAGKRAFGNVLEYVADEGAPRGFKRDVAHEGLRVLTDAEVHTWFGKERHHAVFKMFLRAFDKAGYSTKTAANRLRPQRRIPFGTQNHRNMHEIWDVMFKDLKRGKGASDRIAELIIEGKYEPSEILDWLKGFYSVMLRENPEDLAEVLDSLNSMRRRIDL